MRGPVPNAAISPMMTVHATVLRMFFTENASPSLGAGASAPCYGSPEDIGILAVVVTELKFCDVEREVFCADLVESAHDAALDEAPEAVNRLRVDGAHNVFLGSVMHDAMREIRLKSGVAGVFVAGFDGMSQTYVGATPALAICAASLRARSAP